MISTYKKNLHKKAFLNQYGRNLFGLIILLVIFSTGDAQTLKRQTIASAGNCVTENGTTVQQTIGQPYNTTSYYSNKIRYNPGFLQPVFRVETIKATINATIYPNPASNQITIETTEVLEDVIIRVIDITGKLLLNEKLSELKSYTIDCSNWSNGVYVLSLYDAKSNLFSAKLIISR